MSRTRRRLRSSIEPRHGADGRRGNREDRTMLQATALDQLPSPADRRDDMRFRTTLLQNDKAATGFEVPPEVVDALGAGKRPKVRVTIRGYTYRSSVAVMGGTYMIGVNAENRVGAGVKGGDEVDVELELDTEPREVRVPADFAEALGAEPDAARTFQGLSFSNKSWHTYQIEGAKSDETRQRRIARSIAALREGRIR